MQSNYKVILLTLWALVVESLDCNHFKCSLYMVYCIQRDNDICDINCLSEVCNFDTPPGLNTKLDKSQSPCLSVCLDYTECPIEHLGDGKCNSGKEYLECNHNVCGFDWGDCGYCEQGCFKEDIENTETCKDECNNVYCSMQGEVCVRFI